jgi:hypothetical protein
MAVYSLAVLMGFPRLQFLVKHLYVLSPAPLVSLGLCLILLFVQFLGG